MSKAQVLVEVKKGLKGMIGLEIHTYLVTKEKLFCKCIASREKGLKANVNICPTCTGQPGAKPLLPNGEAVKQAIRIGLMLGCKINKELAWQRKHYDWPDLPKGYQNTISGSNIIGLGVNGEFEGIGIWSMHLEEDPASWDPGTGRVDYNRSGLPLVEIVTAPDFTTADEVAQWLKILLHNLFYLKSVDTNAGIKVDVNVNIKGKTERVELKNLNSIENIQKAINYELERQAEEGSQRETRRFDEAKGKTYRMRGKEEADDYRFISDPDLVDIILDENMIEELKSKLPESPHKKLEKLIKQYKIGGKDAEVLAKNFDIAEFFERVAMKVDANFALPWITVELLRFLNYNKISLDRADIKPEHFIELLENVKNGKLSVLKGKQILNEFYPKSFSIKNKIEKEGKISDRKVLEKYAKETIKDNKKVAEDYKNGEEKAFNYLMGEIMKKTNRRADFNIAREVLRNLLT
ncbi:MAG: Asp-tRNA(Asn)/Glu-tRNA(Gln) amidotransferase subunit GatB [Nanoarchaeota archaeon]|nr:Asp-tRNA(Asn)/Glu-tRNA(Gln) amidotransferase subunit GatB [Nanoarchaeota archaeon]